MYYLSTFIKISFPLLILAHSLKSQGPQCKQFSPHCILCFHGVFGSRPEIRETDHVSFQKSKIQILFCKKKTEKKGPDGRVDGCALTPSCESTGITTPSCETTGITTIIERKTLELTKKHTLHPKTKEKTQWDGRRGTITIKSNPITAGWVTHKLENTYSTEVHPLEWRIWAQHQASQTGGQQWEEEFLKKQTLKASGIWLQDFDRTGVNKDSTLGGHTQSSVRIGTQGKKQRPHRRLNQTYLLVLEGLLQRQGAAVAHWEVKNTGNRSSGKYSLAWALPESAISPTKERGRLQCWVTSGQTTNREATQPHMSADKWIKVLLSSAHQGNTQLYPSPVPPIRKLAQAS